MTDMEKELHNLGNAFLLFREKAIQAIKRLCMYDGETPQMIWSSDAIDAVRKIPESDGWISVKDRLPEERINPLTQDFQNVICFCDFGGEPKRTDIRVYGFGKRAWENKPHFWHGQQIMDGVITHWMPLPEPPKE